MLSPSQQPVIGVTLDREAAGGYSKFPWYAIRENYMSAVSSAGGLAIALPHDDTAADQYIDLVDGVLLSGGAFDVDPQLFGQSREASVTTVKQQRTAFELAITELGIVILTSDLQLLTRILLPLAKPAIATCVILLFLDTWNEFVYAMIYLQNPELHTVPVALAKIGTSRYYISIGAYSAAIMITVIPVLAIFAIFQRWFIAGMTVGALKH